MIKKITIKYGPFCDAFFRDVNFHDIYPIAAYLDKGSGDIFWVYESDDDAELMGMPVDDNRRNRQRIEDYPDSVILIEGQDHGEHHDILRTFLDSDWSHSEEERLAARNAYRQSIGWWLKSVNNQRAIDGYFKFREKFLEDKASRFLEENGICPVWK